MPCDNFLSNLFDRGQREARRAAAEDTTSGDRERAGWRQRHDEWRQRAHRLAEGDTSRGGRENAERQGNSLGRGGGDREMEGTRQAAQRAGREAKEGRQSSGGGDVGRWNGTRRQEKGRGAHRRLLGRVFGAKRDTPSDEVRGGVHLAEKPYLVPKIRSPASPRPGTM